MDNRRGQHTKSVALELERRNFLILLVAGALALAAAMGLADMAGYGRLVDGVAVVHVSGYRLAHRDELAAGARVSHRSSPP